MELTNIWCNEIEYPEMYTPSYLKDKNLLIEKVIDETRRLLFHTNEHWNGLYKYGYEITNPMTPEIRQHKACLTPAHREKIPRQISRFHHQSLQRRSDWNTKIPCTY